MRDINFEEQIDEAGRFWGYDTDGRSSSETWGMQTEGDGVEEEDDEDEDEEDEDEEDGDDKDEDE